MQAVLQETRMLKIYDLSEKKEEKCPFTPSTSSTSANSSYATEILYLLIPH